MTELNFTNLKVIQMANFALIKDNVVLNIVVVEAPEKPELLFPDFTSVEITEELRFVNIGYNYNNGIFTSNIIVEEELPIQEEEGTS
jgi:hypothetical protein